MTSGSYATYYINLDSSTERRSSIEAELVKAGVTESYRIPAFDGRGLDLQSLGDCDVDAAFRYLGRPLRGAEYGCYRSHLAALDLFLASDRPYGLILEDDAMLDPDMRLILDRAIEKLECKGYAWDVIHISPNRMKIFTPLTDLKDAHKLVQAHYFPMVATALLWSRDGAQNFVDHYRKVTMPIDTMFREVEVRRARGFAIWPPIVGITGADSDIDEVGRKRKVHGRAWYYGIAKQKRLWNNKIIALWYKLSFSKG
ncbi:glycosyl transferase family 25 [Roseinatronobacter thiooxidans]|uniref:Glycosyl transferase family 25 n=1 Tax=Roseinatronobacter thiooxidans TaxID=121821 RepID=A0A2W7PSS1_9RHOB|nr:glycosyltransferase family 25 protein [Roseinatronobacter thiooxidans]PZX36720.1 glycosyl transferase family 25 [Roseinatronobacter thiooxidans]